MSTDSRVCVATHTLIGTVVMLAGCSSGTGTDTAAQRIGPSDPNACAALLAAERPNVEVLSATPMQTSARPPTAAGGAGEPLRVAHCKVAGTIDGSINFELLLPSAWNGKLVMGGGGGYVGSVQNQAQGGLSAGPTPLERGYATVGTDTGHSANGLDASWALNNRAAQENFAFRAVHRTAEVAKAITATYYDQAPARSYFMGCSRGGGQALIEAQRYPDDFDGIVAAAPVIEWAGTMAGFLQNEQAVFPDPNDLTSPVISADNRKLLAAALRSSCDVQDGIADGILNDPRTCGFDPKSLPRCTAGAAPECLTDAQLGAIETIYRGPQVEGQRVHPGFPFGGEDDPGGWDLWITQRTPTLPGAPNLHYAFGTQFAKNFVFADPDWSYAGYDFADWRERTADAAALLNATDADLSKFNAHGGKLIIWHGWSDSALTALRTIDYYQSLAEKNSLVRLTSRLFLLPGVEHCGAGPGPDRADWLTTLEQWVEQGVAPDQVTVAKDDAQGRVTMERSVCAYPLMAEYDGKGEPNRATSYACAGPRQ